MVQQYHCNAFVKAAEPKVSIYPRRLCADNADMQCGRDESHPYNMFLKKHAFCSYRNCEDAAAYIKITLQ